MKNQGGILLAGISCLFILHFATASAATPAALPPEFDAAAWSIQSRSAHENAWQGIVYTTFSVGAAGSLAYFNLRAAWPAYYDGASHGPARAVAIAPDRHGNVYLMGTTLNATNSDWITLKFDSAGSGVWITTYDGPGQGNDQACALAVDSEGHLFVTGTSYWGPEAGRDIATIKYSPDGEQLWLARMTARRDETSSGALTWL